MAKRRKPLSSRDAIARRWTFGLLLALSGVAAGWLLGLLVVGGGLHGPNDRKPSFADLSSNPDALATGGPTQPPCYNCADSYGVAARLRAKRESRMGEPFRRLGEVEVDTAAVASNDDDYRYGGRFPDPEPIVMVSPVAITPPPETSPAVPVTPPASATAPSGKDIPAQ